MKNIKFLIFTILIFFVNVFCVYASCTQQEIIDLKEMAENIKITYKHLGLVELENGENTYSSFEVKVKNISDDLYLSIFDGEYGKLASDDGMAKLTLDTGNWNLKIYSNKCNVLIDEIDFRLPRFNIYSLDPLCENIDGEEFELCGKYYEEYVLYDDFVNEVNSYRYNHNIKYDENNVDRSNNIYNKILEFLLLNKIYIIIVVCFLLLLLLILLVIKKIRKRGVLE